MTRRNKVGLRKRSASPGMTTLSHKHKALRLSRWRRPERLEHALLQHRGPKLRSMNRARPCYTTVRGQTHAQNNRTGAIKLSSHGGEEPLLSNEPADAPCLTEQLSKASVELVQNRQGKIVLVPIMRAPRHNSDEHESGRFGHLHRGLRTSPLTAEVNRSTSPSPTSCFASLDGI